MNRDYKVGDWVIWINKKQSVYWKEMKGISLYGKLAKIIYINKYNVFLLEYKDYVGGYSVGGYSGEGKDGHCWFCLDEDFELAIDSLKFKKWIKG